MFASSEVAQNGSSTAVNVFITGQPGIGKTTLVLKVIDKLPPHLVAGFYTVEAYAEGSGERIGFDVVTLTGERAPLCRLRRGCGPKVGKYYVAIEEFERIVLPHLTPSPQVKLHIIDEVGRMALASQKFAHAVVALLGNSKAAVFGTLPSPRFGHPLPLVDEIKLRPDTSVLTLTKANRDATNLHLVELMKGMLVEDSSECGVSIQSPKPSPQSDGSLHKKRPHAVILSDNELEHSAEFPIIGSAPDCLSPSYSGSNFNDSKRI